jgi:hypothetical protein
MPSPLVITRPATVRKTPIENKIVRGTVTQVNEEGEVFATVPSFSPNFHYGPLEYTTQPSVGDEVAIAFDTRGLGYVFWIKTP